MSGELIGGELFSFCLFSGLLLSQFLSGEFIGGELFCFCLFSGLLLSQLLSGELIGGELFSFGLFSGLLFVFGLFGFCARLLGVFVGILVIWFFGRGLGVFVGILICRCRSRHLEVLCTEYFVKRHQIEQLPLKILRRLLDRVFRLIERKLRQLQTRSRRCLLRLLERRQQRRIAPVELRKPIAHAF